MFTPVHTSLGALLLFQGSSGLLLHNGAVFGISSLISGCVQSPSRQNVPIVAGLLSSAAPVYWLAPFLLPAYPAMSSSLASVASTLGVGFLLGWGTKVLYHQPLMEKVPLELLCTLYYRVCTEHTEYTQEYKIKTNGIRRMAEAALLVTCSVVSRDFLPDP